MTRDTFAEIDLSALRHNYAVAQQCAPQQNIMPVIKADAYGHGAVQAAQTLNDAPAFAVALLEEAEILRAAGIIQPLLLLEGVHHADEWSLVLEKNYWSVIHNEQQLMWLQQAALKKPVTVWLKINTGMNRLGIELHRVDAVIEQLKKLNVNLMLMSHFASADEPENPIHAIQLKNIAAIQQRYPEYGWSVANSAAVLAFNSSPLVGERLGEGLSVEASDLVSTPTLTLPLQGGGDKSRDWSRPGIMLYGSSPFESKTAIELNLKPVMRLKTKIMACHELKQGDSVGYGAAWVAQNNARIAVLAIGYADGYARMSKHPRHVWIHDRLCPVIGRVSMDMITVDITQHPQAQLNDEVELWGEQFSVDEAAKAQGSISYELLTGLTARVPRIYL